MAFYAYAHARPGTTDCSGVFYVGKGTRARHKALPARNRYHGFVLDKYGPENILVGRLECSNEEIAFELEKGLIKCFRRAGVGLANMTEGGEGSSGYVMPQEARDKIAVASAKLAQRPEVQESRRAASKAFNQQQWSDPAKAAKVVSAMQGVPKKRTAASDAARRANALKSQTPEANAKKAEASKKLWADPVFREKVLRIRREKAAIRRSLTTIRKD